MKKLSVISILCMLLFAANAFGWQLTWYNDVQLFQQDGITPLGPMAKVQLIYDAAKDGIDDPYAWWMSQADPTAAMQSWLAAGCPPVGDDLLVVSSDGLNPGFIHDFSGEAGYTPAEMDGWFFVENGLFINATTPGFGSGVGLYTRFFSAENPTECDWYGEDFAPQNLVLYQLDGADFPTYAVHGGQVDQHIEAGIPEPASISMILGGIGMLLAFFRRKK
jgi:hypothetical protein